MNKSPSQMTFLDHIVELRSRLLKTTIAVAIAAVIGLIYCKEIFHWLQEPMLQTLPEGSAFIATTPFEAYTTYLMVALVTGIFLASPFVFYQFWLFITPALLPNEKKSLLPFASISGLLFTGGALFGYFVVFPAGFYYVNAILEGTAIQLLPKMSDYFGTAVSLLFIFGVCFELPLFIFILGKLGLIEYAHIRQYRRYVIVIFFILAAILTPGPDILSQCLLALPLWILYEVGGLSLKFMARSTGKTAS